MPELYEIIVLMAATGIIAGVLSGLFGVGGGIIMVPVLEYALIFTGIAPEIRMHAAVATSLSIVILTTISSSYAHYRRSSLDTGIIAKWWLYLLAGSILGIALASVSNSNFMAALFGVMTLLIALKMLFLPASLTLHDGIPGSRFANLIPVAVGSLSSIMGIGGGTLGVPALTLLNYPIHKAVGTAAFFGIIISIPGTAGYIITGMGHEDLPLGFIGHVNFIGFLIISPIAMLSAPLGAKIAHIMSGKTLKFLFGFFLMLVSSRMIYRALTG